MMTARLMTSLPLSFCLLAALGTLCISHDSNAAAIGTPVAASHVPSTAPVTASEGWIRWLPGNAPMAAYMLLTNKGSATMTLVSASSPRFTQIMLHQSVDMSGMSQMKMVATLVLPPHQTVAIAPGGYHLMLMSPQTPVAVGERIPMTLQFSDGQRLDVTLPVSPPTRMR